MGSKSLRGLRKPFKLIEPIEQACPQRLLIQAKDDEQALKRQKPTYVGFCW
jgi:hypothetical protein